MKTCPICNRNFKSGGFATHIKSCNLTLSAQEEIRSLYLSGMLIVDIEKRGFKRYQIISCIKDIKKSINEVSKITYKRSNKKLSFFRQKQVQCICGCGKICNNPGAFQRHKQSCAFEPGIVDRIISLYESGESLRQLVNNGYRAELVKRVFKNRKTRSSSESLKLIHKLHPECSHKWTNDEKQYQSNKRKEWLEKNKNKHNWRFKGEVYPERIFREWLESENIEFEPEYTPDNFDRFFKIDFAILKIKLAIELNGNQHYEKDGSFKDWHVQRQKYIEQKGWFVLNIRSCDVTQRFKEVKKIVFSIISLLMSFHKF